MSRGRPIGSKVRQNIVDILFYVGKAHGYKVFKIYRELFPKVTLRGIYYHLNKGVETGEFEVEEIKQEEGDYSWGGEAKKIYYKLGKHAVPSKDPRVKVFFDTNGGKFK